MSEENESHPEENKNDQEPLEQDDAQSESSEEIIEESSESGDYEASSDTSYSILIQETKEFQSRAAMVRLTFIVAALSIMALGLWNIYKTGKTNFYEPAKSIYDEFEAHYKGVEGDIDAITKEYDRLEPKVQDVISIVKSMRNPDESALPKTDGNSSNVLRDEVNKRWENHIKPAAENLRKALLVDLQDDLLTQWEEMSAHSDLFMFTARDEYAKLTNGIPSAVSEAIEQTLATTISEREDELRAKFPKLTKEKQAALVSRLSEFSETQGEAVFLALFQDHISEVNKLQETMDAIYIKEGGAVGTGSSVESTISLMSALMQVIMTEIDTGTLDGPAPDDKKEEKDPPSPAPKSETPPTKKEAPAEPKSNN